MTPTDAVAFLVGGFSLALVVWVISISFATVCKAFRQVADGTREDSY